MFDRVMRDEEVCAAFLETVLGVEVERIEYLQVERHAVAALGSKAVRMDVYARDRIRAYNVEMQACRKPYLGRRLRYYQGSMDVADLRPGHDYGEMPDSYIVFLCAYDPLGRGLPAYTVRPACEEAPDADLEAGQCWVALNAQAWRDGPHGGAPQPARIRLEQEDPGRERRSPGGAHRHASPAANASKADLCSKCREWVGMAQKGYAPRKFAYNRPSSKPNR